LYNKYYKSPILKDLFRHIEMGNMPVFGHPMLDYDIIEKVELDSNEENLRYV
jgi:hypothetical protein